jgi:hypothetical protein
MATYGNNSLAVRFFREVVDEPTPDKKSAEMPAYSPQLGRLNPGGQDYGPPGPGRRRTVGMKNLPWRSWLQQKRPTRKKKRNRLGALMG